MEKEIEEIDEENYIEAEKILKASAIKYIKEKLKEVDMIKTGFRITEEDLK